MNESANQPVGIVLRTSALRESDLLAVLFTDRYGRVSAVARGARRSQRRFGSGLSPLVLARYGLARRRGELWSLERADIIREWTHLASDELAVAHASYASELLGALVPPEAPDPQALALVIAVWDQLAAGGPSASVLRAFELGILDIAGHTVAVERCAACGSIEPSGVFDPVRGGSLCRACAPHSVGAGVRQLGDGARRYLAEIAGVEDLAAAAVLDTTYSIDDRVEAREAVLATINGVVAKPLRSLEYLAKLAAAGRRARS